MRASPALRIVVRHQGLWRAAIVGLALAAAGVLVAWLAGQDEASAALRVALVVTNLTALLAAASLVRMPPFELRWDARGWTLAGAPAGPGAVAGRLAVAIDLGAWMLLRFTPDAPGARRWARRWLPVQRRGLEGDWHALRCAVYCAGPAVAPPGPEAQRAGPQPQE